MMTDFPSSRLAVPLVLNVTFHIANDLGRLLPAALSRSLHPRSHALDALSPGDGPVASVTVLVLTGFVAVTQFVPLHFVFADLIVQFPTDS